MNTVKRNLNNSMRGGILALVALFFSFSLRAQYKPGSNGRFIEINGAQIYYEEYGQGEPLVLLHGFGRTLEDWKPFIGAYAKNYRVLAWDMRGHGRSSSPDSTEVFLHTSAARDLLLFIKKLELKNVKAIGHSSGGILLMQAASREPACFDRIVPVSAQRFFGNQVRAFIQKHARPEEYFQFNQMEEQHGAAKGMLLSRQFHHFHALQGDPLLETDALRKISAATLVVHGDDDFVPVSEAWNLYEQIPGARLWIIPDGGHEPHLGETKSPDFIKTTLAFLRGEWKTN